MENIIKIDIVQEFSQLYELSLSIGNSLNLVETCDDFLTVWMRQKNVDFGSIWFKNEILNKPNSDNYTLIYANPDFRIDQKEITLNHEIVTRLEENMAIFVNSEMANFQEFNFEKKIASGTYWLIRLPNLGFIKFYYSKNNLSQAAFDTNEAKKAAKVIQKFSIALQSCLLHNQVLIETEQKILYQKELKKLAIVAEKTDNAIVITDAFGKIEWVNVGFSRISGFSLDEVKGKTPGQRLQGKETNRETIKFIREQLNLRNSFQNRNIKL